MTLQCPGCKTAIDDDSCYCDQCGAELMKCGMCGYTGKGKVCPNDRTPLLPAKALAATRGSTANVAVAAPAAVVSAKPVAVAPPPSAPAAVPAPPPPPVARALCLRSAAHGLQLRPGAGDVLGRRFGPHADQLARFAQISSNHLELQRDAAGQWFGKDMDSFNGSFYNGRKLAAGQAQLLEAGATLALGDVAFTVGFE